MILRFNDRTIAMEGNRHISMEDFAIAMIDEVEPPAHSHQRFAIGS